MDEYPSALPGDYGFMLKPKADPPPFGIWLNLLAIGLTLTFIRMFSAIFTYRSDGLMDSPSGIDVIHQVILSLWALANLVLMIKRSCWFPKAMIALLGANALVVLIVGVGALLLAPAIFTPALTAAIVVAPAVAFAWIVYLLRSERVRRVFVR